MKFFIIIIISLNLSNNLYSNGIQCYHGTNINFMYSNNVYLIKKTDSIRIITTVEFYYTQITCDTTFIDTTINCDKFHLIKTKDKLLLKVNIINDIYEGFSFLQDNRFQNIYHLKSCSYKEILERINHAYTYKIYLKDYHKLEQIDFPKRVDLYSEWNFISDTNNTFLDENKFKLKVDSLSLDFWNKIKKDSSLSKYLEIVKTVDEFNGLGLSYLGIGKYNNKVPLNLLDFEGTNYNGLTLNIFGVNAKKYNGFVISGFSNMGELLDGVFISGFALLSQEMANGLMISGIFQSNKKVNGVSICPMFNFSNTLNGVQISCLNNKSLNLKGLQLGAYNNSECFYGIQIGIFNYSKKTYGFQIGLLNINEKRWLPIINWNFD